MLWQGDSFVRDCFHSVAPFQQFDDEFFKCNWIVCPKMVRRLVTTEGDGKINTIFG